MIFFLFFFSLCTSLIFFNYSFNLIALGAFLLSAVFLMYKKEKKMLIVMASGFLAGAILFVIPKGEISGTVSLKGIVTKAEENYFLVKTFKGTFYVKSKGNSFEIGDLISINGTVSNFAFTHFQESFDFGKYLNSLGASKEIKIKSSECIFKSLIRMKAFSSYVLEGYSDNSKALIGCLIFGKSSYELESYNSLKNLGLIGAITASGIHISFVKGLLDNLLSKRIKREHIKIIDISFEVVLYFLSGFSLTLLRIIIMDVIGLSTLLAGASSFSYTEKLSIAGTFVLIFHPCYVLNIGFFFSYPVLLIFGFLRSYLSYREKYKNIKISWMFFFTALPINMMMNYSFSLMTLLLQWIVAPVMSFMFTIDLLVFFGSFTKPFLEKINSFISKLFSYSSGVDLSLTCGKVSVYFTLIYYAVLILGMLIYELHIKKALRVTAVALVLLISFTLIPDVSKHYEVRFIDVGQGDSTLVRYENKNILIDTGGSLYNDLAVECLIPYFKSLKISKLDAVLTTHDDYDHVGALDSLNKNFKINNIYKGGDKKSIDIGNLHFDDLNSRPEEVSDANYNSAVYSFKIKETSFLVMGDAPVAIEKDIITRYPSLDCDILKVGHHGSDTSSCREFLTFTSPNLAVISCGLNNKYGHPSKSVVSSLEALSIPYVRTDLSGTYVYKIR